MIFVYSGQNQNYYQHEKNKQDCAINFIFMNYWYIEHIIFRYFTLLSHLSMVLPAYMHFRLFTDQ